ncbi:MAG: bifunctional diguanylate cyclase/phosphodiesterase [Terracidiphilus sp.]
MQETVIAMVFLSLLIFLFASIMWTRRDDRLRCWVAGWLFVLAHFAVELWQPSTDVWRIARACALVDLLSLAGISFIVSTMILREGRKQALRLWIALAVPAVVCLSLVTAGLKSVWMLGVVIVVGEGVAVFKSCRVRPNRALVSWIAVFSCVMAGGWSLYGIANGQPELVIAAVLAEIFFVSAIGLWVNGWQRTAALHTMALGMVGWALTFPIRYWVERSMHSFPIGNELWWVPLRCVGVGMILVVLEEELRRAKMLSEEYRLLFAGNPHPMWIFEAETLRFLDVNQAGHELHGYSREEFLRLKLTDTLHPEIIEKATREVRSTEPIPNRASRHVRKDGTIVPMDITAYAIDFKGKRCRIAMAQDVTEREALAQKLIDQERHDALTGLSNRLLFQEQLVGAVGRAVKSGDKLAILCLDIQRFKHINDLYSPRVGDECIQRVAVMIRSSARGTDVLARTGGDEFTLVLSSIRNAVEAEQIANDLREAFSEPLEIQGYRIPLSLSMGLAICPDDGTEADALWRGAEGALRKAQADGGGQTVWFSPEQGKAAQQQIEIEAYMRENLSDGRYKVVYQPFYGFDGQVHAMEALLRLDHPWYGPVSPVVFIPIAEATGLIVPLGQWVIEEVCRQLVAWSDQGMRLVPVAVNISALQLMHVEFAERLVETLIRYGIDPMWIHLEVTESAVMGNLDAVSNQIAALSALGISFSLDDFGTGLSSLGRLHRMSISVVKIDRSFIKDLCADGGTYAIVQAIVSMAHTLGHLVVAEGVETEMQLAYLCQLHCDLLQGFLLARPMRPDEIPALTCTTHPAIIRLLRANCYAGQGAMEVGEVST